MAEMTTVARPYARAAFEQAQATGALETWSAFLRAASALLADASFYMVLGNPKLGHEQKAQLLEETSGALTELGDPCRNFIRVLAENDRLLALPDIAAIFDKLRAEAEQTVQAQVVAAYAVSDEQRERIMAGLRGRLKRNVVLECVVDESLVGGAVIRAGDLVIDGSVRGQLHKLEADLRH